MMTFASFGLLVWRAASAGGGAKPISTAIGPLEIGQQQRPLVSHTGLAGGGARNR